MKNTELFKACAAQCLWCKEQWGLVEHKGRYIHVAPFTRDPQLFSHSCEAEAIRTAFKYYTYAGGKQVKWKARPAKELVAIMTGKHKRNGGLTRNITSPENRVFWRGGLRATIEVASWPDWKRSGSERVTPERLRDVRDELLFYDECDYAVRQPCTENLQYRPQLDRTWKEPTCNDGIGCATCWGRYERAVKEWEDKNPCCY